MSSRSNKTKGRSSSRKSARTGRSSVQSKVTTEAERTKGIEAEYFSALINQSTFPFNTSNNNKTSQKLVKLPILLELIEAKILSDTSELTLRCKAKTQKAKLNNDGSIVHRGKKYSSPKEWCDTMKSTSCTVDQSLEWVCLKGRSLKWHQTRLAKQNEPKSDTKQKKISHYQHQQYTQQQQQKQQQKKQQPRNGKATGGAHTHQLHYQTCPHCLRDDIEHRGNFNRHVTACSSRPSLSYSSAEGYTCPICTRTIEHLGNFNRHVTACKSGKKYRKRNSSGPKNLASSSKSIIPTDLSKMIDLEITGS